MSATVFIVAEGVHELGDDKNEGSLVKLIRRLAGDTDYTHRCRPIKTFERRVHGKGNRLTKKLVAIQQDAAKEGAEAVVILIDCDGDSDRITAVGEAQKNDITNLPRAIGVAVETYDAWFLADHNSLGNVLKSRVDQQPQPEEMADAKSRVRELINTSGHSIAQRELYRVLAETLDIEILKIRCPRGFKEFATRVEAMFIQLQQVN